MTRSIALHGALLLVVQAAILVAVTIVYRVIWQRFALFLSITVVYHVALTVVLIARREDFRLDDSNVILTRVNLSNSLTMVRLSSIPTIVFLIVGSTEFGVLPILLPLLAIVFVTDLLDGMFARRRHQITFVGRYLDSTSDYLMVIAVSIVFYYFDLIPLWFFLLVMARLVLFAIGMGVLSLRVGKTNPLATFLGKASIFALMTLYVLEIARILHIPWIGHEMVVTIVEYIVAAVVAASMVDKAIFLTRQFAAVRRRRDQRPKADGSA
ncbi:MAG TPA: CDP-alcohol phosphatidyltransferase family protein [Spirochaetia bacterium]